MEAVHFPQATVVLAENQPEYTPLPVHIEFFDPQEVGGRTDVPRTMTACFELTDAEIVEIVKTRKIWHRQLVFGNGFQPVHMSTQNPFTGGLPESLFHGLHELVGAASMCWESPEKAGVFKSERASELALAFIEKLKTHL